VAKGELEIVLEAYQTAALPVHVIYQGNKRISAKVRTFVDFCTRRFQQDPALQTPPVA
jgi:DNA-binding transcriptional LysR family regulator